MESLSRDDRGKMIPEAQSLNIETTWPELILEKFLHSSERTRHFRQAAQFGDTSSITCDMFGEYNEGRSKRMLVAVSGRSSRSWAE